MSIFATPANFSFKSKKGEEKLRFATNSNERQRSHPSLKELKERTYMFPDSNVADMLEALERCTIKSEGRIKGFISISSKKLFRDCIHYFKSIKI